MAYNVEKIRNQHMGNSPSYSPGPTEPTPEQRLFLMNDEEWEAFIENCARQLMVEKNYVQVVRMGGAGDKGRDVCGYTQDLPIEGTWDLYQAKHYTASLSASGFAPELAKLLSSIADGAYARPRNYLICALKFGPSLHDLVMNPEELGAWILAEWKKKNGKFDSFNKPLTPKLEALIAKFPFEIIKIKTCADLLEIHSRSDKHWERFGVIGHRGPNPTIPAAPTQEEQVYVSALLKVYTESTEKPVSNPVDIPSHLNKHFQANRRLFYSAEGLNRFSRDKLPGAFDELLNQVEIGIGSVACAPHPNGMARLQKTLDVSNNLQVTSNPLSARLQAGDLQGSCHHLANQERINWIDGDE